MRQLNFTTLNISLNKNIHKNKKNFKKYLILCTHKMYINCVLKVFSQKFL